MPRTSSTPEEKLEIIMGLLATELTKTAYLKSDGVTQYSGKSWQQIYKKAGLQGLEERNNWTRYSDKTKRQAVAAYLNNEGSLIDISNRFGLRSKTQLRGWIKKFQY